LKKLLLGSLVVASLLCGDEADDFLEGFDEQSVDTAQILQDSKGGFNLKEYGFEGSLTQQIAYSYNNKAPHDNISSLRTSFFLEYNHDLWSNFKLKINMNSFYDFSYLAKGRDKFTQEELDALEGEVELFDAYIEGSLSENLDMKLGREAVVWGKSDTIQIVDVLNPMDNRRPAMVDIEDLRLTQTMAKFDYYLGSWHLSPIAILEQRGDKLPPYGGDFHPSPSKTTMPDKPNKITFALNAGASYSGFDIDFYYADIYPNFSLYPSYVVDYRKKMQMYGTAMNYVVGSLLLKTEIAYKDNIAYLQYPNQTFERVDALVGFEYNGIAETTISFDIADKHFLEDSQLQKANYQTALRVAHDMMHDSLHLNYLISLLGKKFDEGGYQRFWAEYEISDSVKSTLGIVDYFGGNSFFDAISNNDMFYCDISYSF